MLLLYRDAPCFPDHPAEPVVAREMRAFIGDCRAQGVLIAADPLRPAETATTVRVRDVQVMVTDGPFAETREQLGGYFILDCADLDEALGWAARCPLAARGSVEVRPIPEVGGPYWESVPEARQAVPE
jgi:hypothetical protein